MGEVRLPAEAYWGAQTQRAVENFGISPLRIPVPMLRALALVKSAAAEANRQLDLLGAREADAIRRAAAEVREGKYDGQFPIDVFQTGSGTSWNMNMNEVISNRANELLGGEKGTRKPVHPNDHVNRGQSSNDVIPTAMNIAVRLEGERLSQALRRLAGGLREKQQEFSDVLKLGRTHLQDAVPMTLGQEVSAWARQIEESDRRVRSAFWSLEDLPLGGTAIGTGLNTHPRFAELAVGNIAAETGHPFRVSPDPFEGIAARDAMAEFMGALNVLSVSLMKIAQDFRLLASGPRGGLGELILPSLQPGSSIMPGKVNPVIPEMVIQAAAHVMGKHLSVTIGCQNGPLQLNIMQPLIAYETIAAAQLLTNCADVFLSKCVAGLEADRERSRAAIEQSLALVTPLALKIGYDRASKVAYRAFRERRTVREVVLEEGILNEAEAAEILDPAQMLGEQA